MQRPHVGNRGVAATGRFPLFPGKLETDEIYDGATANRAFHGAGPNPVDFGKAFEMRRKVETGTVHANLEKGLGGSSSDAIPLFHSHGGARNRATRTSDGLNERQCRELIDATAFALGRGLSFNVLLTLHLEAGGVMDRDAGAALRRFLKSASDWATKRGDRLAWAFVRENGEGKGSHAHILLHVPPSLRPAFTGRQQGWLKRAGIRAAKGVVLSRRIGGTVRSYQSDPASYLPNLGAALGYCLKGAGRDAADALGLSRREPGGRIIGKRCGTSQNIGRAARSKIERNRAGSFPAP